MTTASGSGFDVANIMRKIPSCVINSTIIPVLLFASYLSPLFLSLASPRVLWFTFPLVVLLLLIKTFYCFFYLLEIQLLATFDRI